MAAAGIVGTILFDLAVILLTAKLMAEIFERFHQPAVLGELIGGVLIGPGVLGIVPAVLGVVDPTGHQEVLLVLAELGAILLLFEVGLEVQLKDIMRVGRAASFVALIGIVGSVLLGFGVSWGLGILTTSPSFADNATIQAVLPAWHDDPVFHLFVGATFAATSVGITARVLKDLGHLASSEARIILGAAVLDDVGALLVLALVSSIIQTGSLDLASLAFGTAKALAFLIIGVLLGIRLAPPLFARLGGFRSRGMILASAVIFALAFAWGASAVDLAPIVGAFAAGMVLAQTREHHTIFEGVQPIAYVFVPVFFVIMGTTVDLGALGGAILPVVVVTLLLTLVAVVAKVICGLGMTRRDGHRLIVGVGMVPRGEVGLIFIATGVSAGPALGLTPTIIATLVLVVMATTFIVPIWLRQIYSKVEAPGNGGGETPPTESLV